MYEEIDFNKYKGKIIDHIENHTDMYGNEYTLIVIYFTDGTTLEMTGSGHEGYLNID